ncbi:MAG: hypothetical protein ACLP0B_12395 [Steroidobacteraceae bacterium]
MKDGRPEVAVYLDTGVLVAGPIHPPDEALLDRPAVKRSAELGG